jgi:hypothetical protein
MAKIRLFFCKLLWYRVQGKHRNTRRSRYNLRQYIRLNDIPAYSTSAILSERPVCMLQYIAGTLCKALLQFLHLRNVYFFSVQGHHSQRLNSFRSSLNIYLLFLRNRFKLILCRYKTGYLSLHLCNLYSNNILFL